MKTNEHFSGDTASKYEVIFEYSPLAIMYTNAQGAITTCNQKASMLFGAPRRKLIGFSYTSIKNELMRSSIEKALSGHQSRFEGGYLTVTGNRLTQMIANFSPAFTPDGSISGVVGVFEDISGRTMIPKDGDKLLEALAKTNNPGNGCLPVCASCKKIRDEGRWRPFEIYFREHMHINFSHGVCPDCAKKLYPGL